MNQTTKKQVLTLFKRSWVFFILLSFHANAQWVNYSQFVHAPLQLTAAPAAINSDIQLTALYRRQSIGETDNINTPSFNFLYALRDAKSGRQKGGIGASLINETTGPGGSVNTIGITGNYHYIVYFNKGYYLSMGLQAGVINRRIDTGVYFTERQFQNGVFNPGIDFGENIENASRLFPTFGTGFTWFYQDDQGDNRAWLGVSAFNINQPDQSFTGEEDLLPVRIIAHGGFRVNPQETVSITPGVRFVHDAGSNMAHIGSVFRYHFNSGGSDQFGHIGGGIWFSPDNVIVTTFEFSRKNMAFGLSYDLPASSRITGIRANNAIEAHVSFLPGNQDGASYARKTTGQRKRKVKYRIK
jgi:type IX secretion system PorP/SprF family membrane protein